MKGSKYSKASLLAILQNLAILDGVNRSDLVKLAEEGTEFHYKKGAEIRREGEKPESFYLILEGMVNVSKISSSGKEFTIDWRYQGETLGWGQVIRGGYLSATYAALEDTYLLTFSKEHFLNFLSRHPIVQLRIADLSIDLINKLFNKLIDVATDSANNRVIKTLTSLYAKRGRTLNLTHKEIAQMAYTTLETTTRVFTQLKKRGIISIARGKIVIRDPKKLHLSIENTDRSDHQKD